MLATLGSRFHNWYFIVWLACGCIIMQAAEKENINTSSKFLSVHAEAGLSRAAPLRKLPKLEVRRDTNLPQRLLAII